MIIAYGTKVAFDVKNSSQKIIDELNAEIEFLNHELSELKKANDDLRKKKATPYEVREYKRIRNQCKELVEENKRLRALQRR